MLAVSFAGRRAFLIAQGRRRSTILVQVIIVDFMPVKCRYVRRLHQIICRTTCLLIVIRSIPSVIMDAAMASVLRDAKLRRRPTERKGSTIDQTILSPGTVSINVQEAFIVDEDPFRPPTPSDDGVQHDTDIRLPNHKAVVSHVALDVSCPVPTLNTLDKADHW